LPAVPAGAVEAQVVRITDGDTIRVSFTGGTNLALRYIGIDTPETDEAFFQEAAAYNAQLILGQTVYLETDVSETDHYGRLLRHVWRADGRLVSEELVAAGLALGSTYPPDVKYQERFMTAERAARAAGRGVWATTGLSAPVESAPANVQPEPACTTVANLRAGPGTDFGIVGQCAVGQTLAVTGKNTDGSWLLLSSGAWIFSSLVGNPPATLAVQPAPVVAAPAPVVTESSVPAPAPQGNCDASYPTVCIPPFPPDLDCGQIPYRRFQVSGADRHGFDGDRDGIGCESN
jgi:endonuclease YncB( thermonuclease family)